MENKHVVQAFSFEGADEALAVSVGFWGLKRRLQLLDTTAGSNGREPLAVLVVPIANEVFRPLAPGRCFPQLLYSPRIAGAKDPNISFAIGTASMADGSRSLPPVVASKN